MATLADSDRKNLRHELAKARSRERSIGLFIKSEERAAMDASDDWLVANVIRKTSSYWDALPEPYASKATDRQKLEMLEVNLRHRIQRLKGQSTPKGR